MENIRNTTFTLRRRIGSSNYKVTVHFNGAGAENYEDKVFRLVQNEVLENASACGIMASPQTNRQSERSAS